MSFARSITGSLEQVRAKWDGKIPELRRTLAQKENRNLLQQFKTVEKSFGRIHALAGKLKQEFTGRDRDVDLFLSCVVANCPVVFLGPPGTAKSLLVRRTAQLCSSGGTEEQGRNGYFEYLLSQFTMPEEIFGIADLKKLRVGEFVRKTANRLPEAHFAFLDEIFRGSSQILNTLLTVINERRFHNGVETLPVPLLAIVGAANEPPNSHDLAAFFDRFPIRIWVDSVLDEDPSGASGHGGEGGSQRERAEDLLKKTVDHDQRAAHYQSDDPVACLTDVVLAQEYLRSRAGPNLLEMAGDAGDLFLRGFLHCRKILKLSDRSLATLLRMAIARGLLFPDADRPVAYLEVLAHAAPSLDEQNRARRQLKSLLLSGGHTGTA